MEFIVSNCYGLYGAFLNSNKSSFLVTFWESSALIIKRHNMEMNSFLVFFPLILTEATMGCIKSKEDKGPAMKYRTDNTPEPVISHVSHYGSDSSQATQSPSIKGSAVNFNSHSMTPFGGPSGMTPFGGASSSFSAVPSPYPSTLTGECYIK